jgi:hypothetical protein
MRNRLTVCMLCLATGCTSIRPQARFYPEPGFPGFHMVMFLNGQRLEPGQKEVVVPSACTNIDATAWVGNGLARDVFLCCEFTEVAYSYAPLPEERETMPESESGPIALLRRGVYGNPSPQLFTLLYGTRKTRMRNYSPACCPMHSPGGLAQAHFTWNSLPKQWSELKDMQFTIGLTYYVQGDPSKHVDEQSFSVTIKKEAEQPAGGDFSTRADAGLGSPQQ